MKKYLLTFAAAALAAGTMVAEDVTLSVASASDIQGAFVEESTTAQGTTKAHYQPVESMKIGDFSFTFKAGEGTDKNQAPALYHLNATPTLRLYKASEMTISFPESAEVGSITCNLSNIKGIDALTVSNGEIALQASDKKVVWNNTAKATSVTFILPNAKGSDGNNPNMQIASFTVSANGAVIIPDDPTPGPTPGTGDNVYDGLFGSSNWTLEDVTLPEELTYIWQWDSKYNCLKASAFKDNKSYASESWAISPVIDLTSVEAPVADFMQAVGPKNMSEEQMNYYKENCGFYAREENGEWVKLTIANWPAADWQFVAAGEMDLAAFAGKKIQLGAKYMASNEISVTWEIKEVVVKDKNTGVVVVADENAPAVYFDLNGRRVAEPSNGLFIKVQGSKVSKVIVK